MAYNAGDVEARLTLDRSDFITGMRLARAEAESFERDYTAHIQLDGATQVTKQVTAMQKKLMSLAGRTYKPKVTVDMGQSVGKITELQTRLTKLASKTYNVKVRVDATGSSPAITKLQSQIQKLSNKSVKIDVDVTEAYAELMRLNATLNRVARDRTINIKAHADTKTAFKNLGALSMFADDVARKSPTITAKAKTKSAEKNLLKLAGAQNLASSSADRHTTRIIAMSTAIIGVAAPALGLLATLLLTLPTVALLAGAAVGAVALGMDGIKKAVKGLDPEIKNLKSTLSDTFEQGLIPMINQVKALFPTLTTGLQGQVKALLGWAQAFTNVVTSAHALDQIKIIFAGINGFMTALTPSVTNMTQSFMTLGVVGTQNLWALSDALNSWTQGFNAMIQQAASTGLLAKAFQQLGFVVGSLLGLLNQLFQTGMQAMAALGPNLTGAVNSLSGAIKALTPILITVGAWFLNTVKWVLDLAAGLANALGPALPVVVTGILALWGAFKLVTAAMKIWQGLVVIGKAVMVAWQVATAAATIVQWGLNAALLANPIGIVVAAVLLLIAAVAALAFGIYELIKNWDTVSAALSAAWQWLVDLFYSIWTPIADWFKNLWQGIVDFFTGIWNGIPGFFSNIWNNIVAGLGNAASAIGNFFKNLPNMIMYALGYIIGSLVKFAINAYNAIVDWVPKAAAAIGNFFANTLPNAITAAMHAAGTWLLNTGKAILDGLVTGITTGFWAVVEFFKNLPGNIVAFFVNAYNWLTTSGVDILKGLGTGIATGFWAVVNWFKALPGMIVSFFTGAAAWLVNVGSDIINGLWNGLVTAFWAVVGWVAGLIASFIQGFKDGLGIASPSTIFASIGMDILNGLLVGLQTVAGAVWAFFQMIWTTLTNIAVGAWNFISSSVINGVNFFVGVWNAIWGGISGFFSFVWQGIQNIAITVWNAISSFLINSINGYFAFWTMIWNAISGFFGAVWAGIQNIAITVWNAISSFFTAVLNGFLAFWSMIWQGILNFFSMIWNGIVAQGTALWNALSAFFTSVLNGFIAFWSFVWNSILAFFTMIWNGIKAQAILLWNMISSFFTTALNAFIAFWSYIWNSILAFFTNTWNFIRDTAMAIWNAISSWFSNELNMFIAIWTNIWNRVKDIFTGIWNALRDTAGAVWDQIKGLFVNGVNAVIDIINFFAGAINKAAGLVGINLNLHVDRIALAGGGPVVDVPVNYRARGGPVSGQLPGFSPGHDSIPAQAGNQPYMLAGGEYIVNPRATRAMGSDAMAAINNAHRNPVAVTGGLGRSVERHRGGPVGRPVKRADGGPITIPESLVKNHGPFLQALADNQTEAVEAAKFTYGSIPDMIQALAMGRSKAERGAGGVGQQMQGYHGIHRDLGGGIAFARGPITTKPYVWGGTNPNVGTDCSGYQGMITRVLRNQAPARIGSTANFPWPGFTSGLTSVYAIGSTKNAGGGVGHMAGTLAGVNVESGSGHGPRYGGNALGADNGLFNIHASLPEVGGQFASGGAGGGGFMSNIRFLVDLALAPLKAAINGIGSKFGFPGQFAAGLVNKLLDGITGKADQMNAGAIGGGAAPPGVINDWIMQALGILGWPANYAAGIYQQIMTESGGNPNAIQQIHDVNSGGNEARGIMQVIPPTFRANALPGHGNIMNPVDNIIAGSRYAMNRYGSGWFNPGPQHSHGYDTGGMLPKGLSLVHNATNQKEHMGVFNDDQWKTLLDAAAASRDVQELVNNTTTNNNGLSSEEIEGLLDRLAKSGGTTNISAQLPQGTTIKQMVQELMFQLRHSGKGVFD